MFFSLSLGLGTMTAYASYLPKDADQINNSMVVSFLNCGFEFIAGIAIFSMLFAFAIVPAGGTLSLSFFVIPQGIAEFPFWIKGFGVFFFFLLVIAGLTSAVSLVEGQASALIDKLGISRAKGLTMVMIPGIIGSLAFALPQIIDPAISSGGTLGFSLLDMLDHWAFGYSLLIGGLIECVMIGWVLGADKLRTFVNEHSKFTLGKWFNVQIKFVIPTILTLVIVGTLWQDLSGGLYQSGTDFGNFNWLPAAIPVFWIIATLIISAVLTNRPSHDLDPHNVSNPA